VRAVNLIPSDSRRGPSAAGRSGGAVYVLLAALAVAVALVAVYVSTTNQISNQRAKVTALQAQAAAAQGTATKLGPYVQFAQLAQARASTIRGIASSRFDWQAALAGLSRVVPANTSLQSLVGSVVPGAGGGTGSGGGLRGAIQAPAFQITGCSGSQDDVARLVSRLRLIDGVTRVSLQDSQKSAGAQSGSAVSTTGSGAGPGGGGQGCGANRPTFDAVVFFQPLANAGVDGVTSLGSAVSSTTTTGGTK
jgi:Tfp pilus assembly protein PilN